VLLLLLSTQPDAVQAYEHSAGTVVLLLGGGVSLAAYRAMLRIARLPTERPGPAVSAVLGTGPRRHHRRWPAARGVRDAAGATDHARRPAGAVLARRAQAVQAARPLAGAHALPDARAAAAPGPRTTRSGCSSGGSGGIASVRRRLEQLGGTSTVEQFRAEQVVWGAVGLAAALAWRRCRSRPAPGPQPLAVLVSAGVLTALGVLGARPLAHPSRSASASSGCSRSSPTVAELLALAVTAGEGPVGALERVQRTSDGELSRELGRALSEARAGASLVKRSTASPAHLAHPAVPLRRRRRHRRRARHPARRGPARPGRRRPGGRSPRAARVRRQAEIAMMVPVVFLVLPVTLLFALFPGFYGLSFVST
jgi:tight adherence protein C